MYYWRLWWAQRVIENEGCVVLNIIKGGINSIFFLLKGCYFLGPASTSKYNQQNDDRLTSGTGAEHTPRITADDRHNGLDSKKRLRTTGLEDKIDAVVKLFMAETNEFVRVTVLSMTTYRRWNRNFRRLQPF